MMVSGFAVLEKRGIIEAKGNKNNKNLSSYSYTLSIKHYYVVIR